MSPLQIQAHSQVANWGSMAFNIAGLLNHAQNMNNNGLSLPTRLYHVIDPAIHSLNIFESTWRFINTQTFFVSSVSLGFNLLGVYGQVETIWKQEIHRNLGPVKILGILLGAFDLWGHATAVYLSLP